MLLVTVPIIASVVAILSALKMWGAASLVQRAFAGP
jgi:hypothetical protein